MKTVNWHLNKSKNKFWWNIFFFLEIAYLFFFLHRFTENYLDQPERGYGGGVVSVFTQLKESNYQDVFVPAKKQFDGEGSYGNGGAMRIAPAALFTYKDNDPEKSKV